VSERSGDLTLPAVTGNSKHERNSAMANRAVPALEALLTGLIDYAGAFPPSTQPCSESLDKYPEYRRGRGAGLRRWLVLAAADLNEAPRDVDGLVSVLSEVDPPRAAALETKRPVRANKPVYCEVPVGELDTVKAAGCFAKLRTGGVKPEAIPSVESVAAFI